MPGRGKDASDECLCGGRFGRLRNDCMFSTLLNTNAMDTKKYSATVVYVLLKTVKDASLCVHKCAICGAKRFASSPYRPGRPD
jgi:hypothetical protein